MTLSDVSDIPATHVVIPDTQIEPGDPTDMMGWIGQYLVDQFAGKDNVHVIHLGDHAAMRSLSRHNSAEQEEGLRYEDDIESANNAWEELNVPLEEYNRTRRLFKEKQWFPASRRIILGNHEDFITRAIGDNPKLAGTLSLDHLNYARSGWTVHPFLEVVKLHGISYSHFFVNNANGRAVSGMIETRCKTIGTSFIQGHQQGLKVGMVETVAGRRRGIVAGSCYLKDEGYRGPQARGEWRGILVLFEVQNGDYCLLEVSLDFLSRKYEGMPVAQFMDEKYGLEYAA